MKYYRRLADIPGMASLDAKTRVRVWNEAHKRAGKSWLFWMFEFLVVILGFILGAFFIGGRWGGLIGASVPFLLCLIWQIGKANELVPEVLRELEHSPEHTERQKRAG
ncbi:MAG: hypothetical protein U0R49_01140 [Fimbriimonadales bacterium]